MLSEGLTLDLAVYECLIVVWKGHKLLKKIDEETALSPIRIISNILTVAEIFPIKGFESEVFSLACKEDLTVYDASYLYASMKTKAPLITDGRKLREKASKHVRVLSTEQLVRVSKRQ